MTKRLTGVRVRIGAIVVLLVHQITNANGRQAGDYEKDTEPAEPVAKGINSFRSNLFPTSNLPRNLINYFIFDIKFAR
jgi:hypothetical protein